MPERTGPGQFSRRRFLGAMAAAGVASFVGTGHAAAPPGIRGILLIVGDDHGAQLGCLGTEGLSSPVLDGLAAEGVLFRQNFCSLASCSPSRASLFTGLYPHSHGLPINCHEYFGAQPRRRDGEADAANRGRERHDDVLTLVATRPAIARASRRSSTFTRTASFLSMRGCPDGPKPSRGSSPTAAISPFS